MHTLLLPLLLLLLLLPPSPHAARLVWLGRVTPTSFRLHINLDPGTTSVDLSLSPNLTTTVQSRSPTDPAALPPDLLIYTSLRRFDFTALTPSTKYYVFVRHPDDDDDDDAAPIPAASVRTFPADPSRNLTVVLASCQYRASWDRVFPEIRARFDAAEADPDPDPFLFLHMGDIAYPDIADNDPSRYVRAFRDVLQRDRVQRVFSAIPVAYMYDDHDYGPNNAGFSSPSREAALANFRAVVPTYVLPSVHASYYAFTVANVRFLITDLRAQARRLPGSTLGPTQREWFFAELARATDFDVVVWMSSKPWIAKAKDRADSWGGYAEERRLVADKIVELGVTNLVAVAGDAHMLAADDGSHSDYSDPEDDRAGGFPVFQAAPIANIGTSKGGPYSEGCNAYRLFPNYQYGMLQITKGGDGDTPCVEFSGYKAGQMDEPLIRFKKCGTIGGVDGVGGDDDSCSLPLFPWWVWLLVALAIVFGLLGCCGCITCCMRRRRRKRKFLEEEQTPEQVYMRQEDRYNEPAAKPKLTRRFGKQSSKRPTSADGAAAAAAPKRRPGTEGLAEPAAGPRVTDEGEQRRNRPYAIERYSDPTAAAVAGNYPEPVPQEAVLDQNSSVSAQPATPDDVSQTTQSQRSAVVQVEANLRPSDFVMSRPQ